MGFSPCKVFLGRELPMALLNVWSIPQEAMQDVSNNDLEKIWSETCTNLEKARKTMVKKYDKDRVENSFQVEKLAMPYHGPFKILRFLGPVAVLLGGPNNDFEVRKVHLSQIRKFHDVDEEKY
ncbi:hypothetical protein PR048_011731 [Dryococelus australis]|uniref:Uncharacterized protein n=1 Tax=Dryococelus australis TaxID=614101 RepID=A0ABQ9HNN7_9NEOP|nr:hypothetical protein PR048_011731 [Dryococelus australis]